MQLYGSWPFTEGKQHMFFVRSASARDIPAIRDVLAETWRTTYAPFYGAAKVEEIITDWHSEKAIKALGDDEELVVLLPAKEFTIKHGPKRTVLYWLCRNVEFAETINGFLEGEPWSFAYLQHQINQQLVCVTLM